MKDTVSHFAFHVSRFRLRTACAFIAAGMLLAVSLCRAQQDQSQPAQSEPPARSQQQSAQMPPKPPQNTEQPPSDINQEFSAPLTEESERAAGERERRAANENERSQEKMVAHLKFEGTLVRWIAHHLPILKDQRPEVRRAGAYWFAYILDFAILVWLIGWGLKKNLPAMFRGRTTEIQRGIAAAKSASEEANRRLAAIEERLSKLDEEIATMKTAAEQESAAEEQRLLAAAEEEKRRIIAAAEAEIAAASKQARRELKAFTADLAVALAEKRIQVDAATDRALLQGFVGQLSAQTIHNGGPGNPTGGKDGN